MMDEEPCALETPMRRVALLLLMLAGCSTNPKADIMDHFTPRAAVKGQGRGGVCVPTPALTPAPGAPPGARIEAPPPGAVVAPPPEPPAVAR
jgi:hypothetical protein